MTVSSQVAATLLFAALSLAVTACGPPKQPPVDPLKEQVVVLQRQLLELQKVQLDTRKKVDEQAASQTAQSDALANKVKALEKALDDHKNATPPPAIVKPTSTAPAAPAKKKSSAQKPVKKKKPAAQSPQ